MRNGKGQFVTTEKITIICAICEATFLVIKSRIKNAKYCSVACSAKGRKGNKYRLGHHPSDETKTKLSISAKKIGCPWFRGIKLSPETIKARNIKIGLANKGKPFCVEARIKAIESAKERTGEKHPRWITDRTKLKRYDNIAKDRRSPAYQYWRRQIWLRDNFKCKIANPDCEGRIEVHHILGYTEYPELRYQINNGITLCHAHHPRKRAEEKRLSPYFTELVSVSKEIF